MRADKRFSTVFSSRKLPWGNCE